SDSASGGARIRRIDSNGIVTTIAGTGARAQTGDGGPATLASFAGIDGLAYDAAGNLYVSDVNVVRRIGPDGIVSTYAGNRVSGFSGDGGPATAAQLNVPRGLAVDSRGSL